MTGHEICRYFYEYQYRMEWETTLDSTKIIEVLDPETVIFYQVHKRVWPAAQRDSCFWSHIRSIAKSEEDQPTWLVVNYTTPHQLAPVGINIDFILIKQKLITDDCFLID